MIKKCPQCGERFDILWPHLWRYRIGQKALCSWSCYRAFESEEENDMGKITDEQRNKAIEIALDGGDPKPFLKKCGSIAPDKLWYYIKMQLKKKQPEVYEQLAKGRREKPVEVPENVPAVKFEDVKKAIMEIPQIKVDGPLRVETPEGKTLAKIDVPKMTPVAPPFEYRITGISTAVGDFQYYKKQGYLDWTPIGSCNDTVSMKVEEWKEFTKIFPLVQKALEVNIDDPRDC